MPTMDELVTYIVRGLVDSPDDVKVKMMEGDATVMLELSVHPDDVPLVRGEGGQTLHHIRAVLSAAAGRRKAILELAGEAGAESPSAAQVSARPGGHAGNGVGQTAAGLLDDEDADEDADEESDDESDDEADEDELTELEDGGEE